MGILLHMVHAIHYNHTNHLHKYRKSHTHGLLTKIGQIQTICNRMVCRRCLLSHRGGVNSFSVDLEQRELGGQVRIRGYLAVRAVLAL